MTGVRMLGAANCARHKMRALEALLLRKGYLEGLRCRISVERGEVQPAVSQLVVEQDLDLVGLGTRGKNQIGKLLMGSIAEKIVPQVACPCSLSERTHSHRSRRRCALQPSCLRLTSRHRQIKLFRMRRVWPWHPKGPLIGLHVLPQVGIKVTFNQDRAPVCPACGSRCIRNGFGQRTEVCCSRGETGENDGEGRK